MSEQNPPKIEFPCPDYPIKVLGDAGETLYSLVLEVMENHAPGFDAGKITVRDSGKGRYQSVTVYITATGIAQLETIHKDLRAHPAVKIVL
ncbi:YbeD family protein [Gilvimarinus algae]|uniref:UPF0250 protein QWI16_15275 n=1 Tax=Gilvimarinus algae TaxID=3058037 RepID=A0ABT8THZ0_9GAMM|nr:DUF493 domain-containing protein [Gilvimarinus sp. SDUM040014]MDO3383541.1 DUF493 domain-containing protein [Gilvimarinus sp. SDUM040014]